MSPKQISRRTVLRGLGTAVSLPILDAMLPRKLFGAPSAANATGASAAAATAPRRMAFIYVPNGVHMPDWTPTTEGADYALPDILKPMAAFKDDMLVLGGLTCDKARANGDGAGDHARASASFLTGCQAKKTGGANFQAGISADQVAAMRIGDQTRLSSLEIAIERFRGSGNCDSGYSCVYEHTLAWRSANSPLPTEVNPRQVFDRLFAERPNDAHRLQRSANRASVLDAVMEDVHSLDRRLGGSDRGKMDQYLSSVRELELRIQRSDKLSAVNLPDDVSRPDGVPADLTEHFRLLSDLMVLAFQTDVTRVGTFMFAREGSQQKYTMVGVNEGHHNLSHHQGRTENHEQLKKINTFHVSQLAYLTERLKAIPEGAGTLLDNCMIAYGSAIADGNRHEHHNLPMLLVGKGGGTIQSGRHIRFPRETPLNNLWLAMLERMGVKADKLGDSTGLLDGLS